ncbi:MurR/RpiR family transcriptional regulator [Intestinimonas butyriciproducens]|uniref:MurR/RpiR family transcriptional regulator n=1 Tax=Candidatus Intestinimonas merdavium TaxID=2838622 RepID=A0A9D1Z4C2_9FIRM|nr:MurR/RpiR family transcriptional regulator [Intestinimonas butyriciproducens]MBM6974290.1 MurR/RpiR family transcriptional regulator [Intestinimonas butyriciproducens]HIY73276.1 MurR/RpiR family transcriptional regulator [Candidatus Intestinimonas merdavium]
MTCTVFIRACLDQLTETDRRLASYLLDHSREAIHMSAKELSAQCDTSPAAVVRLSQKLGFKGFTALKLELAKESGQEEPDVFRSAIRDNDDMETIVRKAEQIHLRNTSLTYQMVNVSVLSQAVEEICAGRRIHLFGVGASGLLAMDFLYKSSRIGIPAFYHADVHTNLATAALLGPEDIVIAISYSGETLDTVLAAEAARERGSKIIAITQANRNTLSRLADYPLYIPGEEPELRVGAMTSRTSGLLILDLLFLGIAKHNPEQTQESLRQTRELIRTFQRE